MDADSCSRDNAEVPSCIAGCGVAFMEDTSISA